jgi:hypothetical protein
MTAANNQVAFADNPQGQRPDRHVVFLPEMPPRFMMFHMDPFMENPALRGKTVLFPDLFQMYQGKTPVTITNVR